MLLNAEARSSRAPQMWSMFAAISTSLAPPRSSEQRSWPCEDDAQFDSFRSPSSQKVRIAFDTSDKVVAMDHAASGGWPTQLMIPAFLSKGKNGNAIFNPVGLRLRDFQIRPADVLAGLKS